MALVRCLPRWSLPNSEVTPPLWFLCVALPGLSLPDFCLILRGIRSLCPSLNISDAQHRSWAFSLSIFSRKSQTQPEIHPPPRLASSSHCLSPEPQTCGSALGHDTLLGTSHQLFPPTPPSEEMASRFIWSLKPEIFRPPPSFLHSSQSNTGSFTMSPPKSPPNWPLLSIPIATISAIVI